MDFVRFLYDLDGPGRDAGLDGPNEVRLIGEVKRQRYKVDVFFQARVGNRNVSFIIEDKTDTSYRAKELTNYRNRVSENERQDEIVAIYFKSGGWFPEDHAVTDFGYRKLDSAALYAFLTRYDIDHPVFRDFVDHLARSYVRPQQTAVPTVLAGDHAPLSDAWVAAAVMDRVREPLVELHRQYAARHPALTLGELRRGTSVGRPWTQFNVMQLPAIYGKEPETLFYRLDQRTGGHYLSLRQYAIVRHDAAHRATKVARLERYRELVTNLSYDGPLRLGRCVTDRSGNNEPEIFVFFLQQNPVPAIIQHLSSFHESLLQELASSSLLLRRAA